MIPLSITKKRVIDINKEKSLFSEGSLILLYGKPGSGKTRYIISKLPKDKHILYIDLDHIVTTNMMENLKYYVATEWEGWKELLEVCNKNLFDIIVIDSLSNIDTKSETYGDYKNKLKRFFYSLNTKTCIVCIDQIRNNMKGKMLNYSGKIIKNYANVVLKIEKHNTKGNYIKGKIIVEKNLNEVDYPKEYEVNL